MKTRIRDLREDKDLTQKELADKYLDLFSIRSGIEKNYIQRWIPIVAAEQMANGKEEEQEFLRHWVDVLDYE